MSGFGSTFPMGTVGPSQEPYTFKTGQLNMSMKLDPDWEKVAKLVDRNTDAIKALKGKEPTCYICFKKQEKRHKRKKIVKGFVWFWIMTFLFVGPGSLLVYGYVFQEPIIVDGTLMSEEEDVCEYSDNNGTTYEVWCGEKTVDREGPLEIYDDPMTAYGYDPNVAFFATLGLIYYVIFLFIWGVTRH